MRERSNGTALAIMTQFVVVEPHVGGHETVDETARGVGEEAGVLDPPAATQREEEDGE